MFLLISLTFAEKITSQSATCVYSFNDDNNEYECKLTLNASDESAQISGQYLHNQSDEDVKSIQSYAKESVSTILPTVLCKKFENVREIIIHGMGLEKINENSLKNCKNLERLQLGWNKIKKLPENAFASQSKMNYLWLNDNQLTKLHEKSFANLTNLNQLNLDCNELEVLPNGIFAAMQNLQFLFLNNNKLTALHKAWFGDEVKMLKFLFFANNKIISIDEEIFDKNRDLNQIEGFKNSCTESSNVSEGINDFEVTRPKIKSALKNCFKNYNKTLLINVERN